MALPNVTILIGNGALGRVVSTADGVAGLIGSGIATASIALAEPKQIFGTDDAKSLGLSDEYDVTNSTDIYRQIKDFYEKTGEGAELWIMLVSPTVTMADICDPAGNFAPALLDAAEGRIRLLGITRNPDPTYVATYVDGMDDDARAAVMKAQSLSESYTSQIMPLRVLVEGRDFQGDIAVLHDLRGGTQNRAGVVIQGLDANKKAAAVGMALGRMASEPVQRNIGRVKSGDLNITSAYLSDGQKVETYIKRWGMLHKKGYIFPRKFQGKSGYYYNDDPSCTSITDDYSSLARGRVIDKAFLIAYATYVEEIQDDIEIDEQGFMDPAMAKSYQVKIEEAIRVNMIPNTRDPEISGVSATISPRQNLLEADTVEVILDIRPKGYSKNINVRLGFTNPLNA